VAHVVLREGIDRSEKLAAEICGRLKAQLVSYKVPRDVQFCSELPKTATGKIQRFLLRKKSGDP
jgi:acyl-coenzyme A synthetase/AMP-(fatty) acid ligase